MPVIGVRLLIASELVTTTWVQQAQGLLGDRIEIERDQLVTDADLLASLDLGLESLAAHPDGVEADVQLQDLQSVCGADGHRVFGRLDILTTSPSIGARSTPLSGSMEMPSPTIFLAKTGSGTISMGTRMPVSGAMS